MSQQDIRWIQRLNNFTRALQQLTKFIKKGQLSELEQQGLIQSFEYNYELSLNTIKDFYEHQGETGIHGSRDAIRLAFKRGLISDGEIWMNMIKSRALTSHTYNQDTASKIISEILNNYYNEFLKLEKTFIQLKAKI